MLTYTRGVFIRTYAQGVFIHTYTQRVFMLTYAQGARTAIGVRALLQAVLQPGLEPCPPAVYFIQKTRKIHVNT
jgi:hypothetical protein